MTQEVQSITVGTRGSTLARTQTQTVVRAIRSHFPDMNISTRIISTEGDRVQDVAISRLGDKGVFVRNIERALLSGAVDLAVHSLKDVPADEDVPGLVLAAFSPREDARDVLISRDGASFLTLPAGSIIGTSSLRRRVQLAATRPDLCAKDIRGNVDTRLRKLRAGEYSALILAAAGVRRLGLGDAITEYFPVEKFVPDAGQGILAIQVRRDAGLDHVTERIDDPNSRGAARAERACVRALGADCRSPVGAYASIDGAAMTVLGMAAREDGSQLRRAVVQGPLSAAFELGTELGIRLRSALAPGGSYEGDPYTDS